MSALAFDQIRPTVHRVIAATPVFDLHTHLYAVPFGDLLLWGPDELITYHYLIAETLRVSDVSYEAFWAMDKKRQAAHIWQKLFIERAPVSEAARGVITVLGRLGADLNARRIENLRDFYASFKTEDFVNRVFDLANVHTVVMTNDALDPVEREIWNRGVKPDPRFKAVLRIDPVLLGWPKVSDRLKAMGYGASSELGAESLKEIRRFLAEWIEKMNALYVAVSLPPTWRYPDDSPTTRVIREAVIPVTRERNLPFAMMIGVTRQVNPLLRMAGDSLGKSDIASLERVLAEHPRNKFMATMLSRENQHELAVTARKFRNLMVFGCWWFVNNPSLIEEITRMRMELLGPSFIPQHSDARILDQIIYKWDHSRRIIAKVMKDKFADIAAAGWPVSRDEIDRTAHDYLGGNFERFLASVPA